MTAAAAMSIERKIIITGGAGLVGQNLIPRLTARGYTPHRGRSTNTPPTPQRSRRLNPGVEVIEADLARPGTWEAAFAGADTLVLNHAQIGALEEKPFLDNNVQATANVILAAASAPRSRTWFTSARRS